MRFIQTSECNPVVYYLSVPKEEFRGSLLAMKEWIKRVCHHRLRDLLVVLRRKLCGWLNYYGVKGELENDRAVLLRGGLFDTQMAEPEESATFDDMGTVHRPLEAVANANAQSGGETMTGKGLNQPGKTA